MDRNIVLIGMPGAGKSTLGVLLAKTLNYDFVDTDIIIQNNTGHMLYEIIADRGIDEFLSIENKTLSTLECERTIIATGGSAVYNEEAMKHLGENGVICYIKLSCGEIIKRVNNIKTRGIAMKHGKTIQDIYRERVPLYEKYADIIIEADNTGIEESIELIVSRLKENNI